MLRSLFQFEYRHTHLSSIEQHFYWIFFRPLRPLGKSIWRIPLDIRVHRNDEIQEWLAEIVDELSIVETWSLIDDCTLMAW